MTRTEKYFWATWTGDCAMDVYVTDPTQTPNKWQEELRSGLRYDKAVEIVEADKVSADLVDGYNQHTINEEHRIYRRTSLATGNAWEVKLDEKGKEIPSPCAPAPSPSDPRDSIQHLSQVTITQQYQQVGTSGATQLTMTITGFLPQA